MRVAETVAERSTCSSRAPVGAVLLDKSHRIIGTGYNGAPPGEPHCDEEGHILRDGHCIRAVHAEANAYYFSVGETEGSILVVTHFPCLACANLIVSKGTRLVIYREAYRIDDAVVQMFRRRGIVLEQLQRAIIAS